MIVDHREKELTGQLQAKKEKVQQEHEAEIQSQLAARQNEIGQLKAEAGELRASTDTLKSQTESLRPIRQPISSGSAVVVLQTNTDDDFLFQYPTDTRTTKNSMSGPIFFLTFLAGEEVVLEFASTQVAAERRNDGGVLIQSVVTLAPTAPGVGSYADALKKSTRVIVGVRLMNPNHDIRGGTADVTINGVVRFRLVVPAQRAARGSAVIEDLSPMFKAINANQ